MDLNVEISEVVFVGNGADARHTSIHNGQPGLVLELYGWERGRHTVLP